MKVTGPGKRILNRFAILPGFLFAAFWVAGVHGNDMASLEQVIFQYYAAVSSGDFKRVRPFLLPEGFTEFDISGGGLIVLTPEKLQRLFAGPLAIDLKVEQLKVEIEGTMGVATYLRKGFIDREGSGLTKASTLRTTSVWVFRDDGWKLLHIHNSPYLKPGASTRK